MIHEPPLYHFVAIEGNIGVGKTTLAGKLANDTGATFIPEQFAENSFLPRFYENPEQYAFPLELSFLAERHQQLKNELINTPAPKSLIVSDYYFLKSLIFAKVNLKQDEYELYTKLYTIVNDSLPQPDILVYLSAGIAQLQENIKMRGRIYEQNITDTYLIKIQSAYFDFIIKLMDIPVLVIDINGIDFKTNTEDYLKLINMINKPYKAGITNVSI